MAQGPGKYDDIATAARENANALAVVLVVLEGDKGNGFSVQILREAKDDLSPSVLATLLRTVAAEIERDTRAVH